MKIKWIVLCVSALIGPYSALASGYTAIKADIGADEAMKKIVASTGPTGAVQAKLADLGGDCIFSVTRNKPTQNISVGIEGKTGNLLTSTFTADDVVDFERTALSEENYLEGYYEDTFSWKSGKMVTTISMSKSVVTLTSIKTQFTTLSCGDF